MIYFLEVEYYDMEERSMRIYFEEHIYKPQDNFYYYTPSGQHTLRSYFSRNMWNLRLP